MSLIGTPSRSPARGCLVMSFVIRRSSARPSAPPVGGRPGGASTSLSCRAPPPSAADALAPPPLHPHCAHVVAVMSSVCASVWAPSRRPTRGRVSVVVLSRHTTAFLPSIRVRHRPATATAPHLRMRRCQGLKRARGWPRREHRSLTPPPPPPPPPPLRAVV